MRVGARGLALVAAALAGLGEVALRARVLGEVDAARPLPHGDQDRRPRPFTRTVFKT